MVDTAQPVLTERSRLAATLDQFDEHTRAELGIDALGALADGMVSVRSDVGRRGGGLFYLIIGLFEASMRAARLGADVEDLKDTHRSGWVLVEGHSRRQYLRKRYGAAVIDSIESAARVDLEGMRDMGASLLSEFAPVIDAIVMAATVSRGSDPTTWRVTIAEGKRTLSQLLIEMCGGEEHPLVLAARWPAIVESLLDTEFPNLRSKYDGARWVLDHDSPDAVSQAANSVVELLDHFLRSDVICATNEEIAAWCAERDAKELMYEADGNRQPTKRGVFAFVFDALMGSTGADEARQLRDTLSAAAVGVRRSAERLKHSGTVEDRVAVEQVLHAAEAIFVVVDFCRGMDRAVTAQVAGRLQTMFEQFEREAASI